ncbi:MAG: hypothetical protein NC098_07815 [Lachnoclostridium sp.]|nr:hypothetical protein [Lachnoclostridium sp.]
MSLIDSLKSVGKELLQVIFPDRCTVCSTLLVEGEDCICLNCLTDLPLTGINPMAFNGLHERVMDTNYPVERVASLMWYYRESQYVNLIHDAKYRQRPRVANRLSAYYVKQLSSTGFFDDIDVILPVPMHFTKKLMRGYNQAEVIAESIGQACGIEVRDNLICCRPHATQTHQNAAQRYENAQGLYKIVDPEDLNGKHILIVDDVLTTGSTMRACISAIYNSCTGIKISLLTLSAAHLR